MKKSGLRGIQAYFLLQTIRFFRLQGSREKAARGFAIGVACNFYPTFGLGGFIAIFLAKLFRSNVMAAFVGGSILAFIWPLLFYLNIQVGSWFIQPAIPVDDLKDVTLRTIDALVWGQTFAIGAIINSVISSVASYALFLAAYHRYRPAALRELRKTLQRHLGSRQDLGRKPNIPT